MNIDYLRVQGDTKYYLVYDIAANDYLRVQGGHQQRFTRRKLLKRLPAYAGGTHGGDRWRWNFIPITCVCRGDTLGVSDIVPIIATS